MDIVKTQHESCCVIEVIGDIDTTSSPSLQKELNNELEQGTQLFIIDMSATRYVSSMGLRVFLSHLKKVKANNGSLVLSGCNQLITDVFRMSGFLNYFKLTTNKSEALELITTIK